MKPTGVALLPVVRRILDPRVGVLIFSLALHGAIYQSRGERETVIRGSLVEEAIIVISLARFIEVFH